MTISPRLELAGVTVRYGDRRALENLSLAVAPGEVVAILGSSGSGKSTLLRSVAGLEPLAGGRVLIDGEDQAAVPVHRRGVGLMFQDQALFPHRDVGANVAFGLRMQGIDGRAAQRRVRELLELVGLPDAEHRAVQELSGGEQQRVALARALAPEPRVLLLDEPLGALDRSMREHLVGALRHIFTERELTVLTVTHDQGEAFTLADRVAVVDAGRLVQQGLPAEVWGAPRDARVAGLLGLNNVVVATVSAQLVSTPWGDLKVPEVADGPAEVLVRPAGVLLDPAGDIEADVLLSAFQGAHTRLELLAGPDTPPLEAEVPSEVAPARGDRVRIRIDPTAVVVLRGGPRS